MFMTEIINLDPLRRIDPLLRVQLEHHPELIAQGFERRFTADESRTKEVVELYTQLGHEVRTVPVSAEELDDNCQGCRSVASVNFHTIYTRPKAEGSK
jgi:hypothetical protein